MQESARILARDEYTNLIAFCESDYYKVAKECDLGDLSETIKFIQLLIAKCVPSVDMEIAAGVRDLAKKAEDEGAG